MSTFADKLRTEMPALMRYARGQTYKTAGYKDYQAAANDLVQDTLLLAHKADARGLFDGKNLQGWLRTILKRIFWNEARAYNREKEREKRANVKQLNIKNREARATNDGIGINEARAMFQKEAAKFASKQHIPKLVFATLTRRIDAVGRIYSQPIVRPKGRAGSSMRAAIIKGVAQEHGLTARMVTRVWKWWRETLKRMRRDLDVPSAAPKVRDRQTTAIRNPKGAGRKPQLSFRERRNIGIECEARFEALAKRTADAKLEAQIDSARPRKVTGTGI